MTLTHKHILTYSILVCIALYITENIYHPVYIVQMLQKVICFLCIPLVANYCFWQEVGKFGRIEKSSVLYGIWFWLFSAVVIGLAYYFLRESIDWDSIRSSISDRGVNEVTFLLVFGYIMFGNSLIEEYFFRGVVFRSLLSQSKNLAYIVSALMFSLYHIAIFWTWFSGYILALALLGLFLGWLFFAWLYQKTRWIWGAWIFHIFADLAILIIGYIELFS